MKWNILKSLNQIYILGLVRKTESLEKDPYIQYLLNSTQDLRQNSTSLFKTISFDETYEKYHLNNYLKYYEFLIDEGLLKPQTRFDEEDIKVLIELRDLMNSKELEELRIQILEAKESLRGFSLMFFKNEKYLEEHPSLIEAIKKIIDVKDFADDKDFQYLYILHCNNPKLIILCENLNFLKMPQRARDHHIELWYAGGKNVEKLKYSQTNTKGLPIFYSGDWDYDGLKIYELVKEKVPSINLLTPTGAGKSILKTEHKSLWKNSDDLHSISHLNANLYSIHQIGIIKELIKKNEWIVEESNDIIEMLERNIKYN